MREEVTEPRRQAFIISDIIIVICAFCVPFFKVPIFSAKSKTVNDGVLKKEVTFRREVESNPKWKHHWHWFNSLGNKRKDYSQMILSGWKKESHVEPMQIHASLIYNITDPDLHLKLRSHSHLIELQKCNVHSRLMWTSESLWGMDWIFSTKWAFHWGTAPTGK